MAGRQGGRRALAVVEADGGVSGEEEDKDEMDMWLTRRAR